jgi:hypothetical protein
VRRPLAMRADGAASTPGLHCVVVRGWVTVGREDVVLVPQKIWVGPLM